MPKETVTYEEFCKELKSSLARRLVPAVSLSFACSLADFIYFRNLDDTAKAIGFDFETYQPKNGSELNEAIDKILDKH
jgi:hypothetical protein